MHVTKSPRLTKKLHPIRWGSGLCATGPEGDVFYPKTGPPGTLLTSRYNSLSKIEKKMKASAKNCSVLCVRVCVCVCVCVFVCVCVCVFKCVCEHCLPGSSLKMANC